MKRKILSLILAAAFLTTAGCAEIREQPDDAASNPITESSSGQSSEPGSSGTYNMPVQEQDGSDPESSTPESSSPLSSSSLSSSSSSSSVPVSSSAEVSSSKPVSSSAAVSSSKPASSSKPVSSVTPVSSSKPASSSKPVSSVTPVSSSKPASSSKPVSSSVPASSSTAPKSSSSLRNEQNPPKDPQIIGNYNRRAPEAWEIEFANEVFRLTNIERAKEGLPEFKKMELLDETASLRAWECLVSYDHTRPDGSKFSTALTEAGIKWHGCGENIAAGQSTPEEVVSAWMKSTGHRANILNPDYEYLGVGFYYDYNNESSTPRYDYFWSQNFCH